MNEERRKIVRRALGLMIETSTLLELVWNEEHEAFTNMSEEVQQSNHGKTMDKALGVITLTLVQLDEMVDKISEF